MAFLAQSGSRSRRVPLQRPLVALALCACAFTAACQKQDEHPPYAAACEANCGPPTVIGIGSGSSAPGTTPTTDAGFAAGTLTGSVLALADATFGRSVPFTQGATVSADGASGTAVSANWDGANPYALSGVAVEATWGSRYARTTVTAERPEHASASELAHVWADELAAGREPSAG